VVLAAADAALLLAVWAVLGGAIDGRAPTLATIGPGTWAQSAALLGSAAVTAGWIGSSRGARRWRELGWEAQAVGIALLGTAWLSGVAG